MGEKIDGEEQRWLLNLDCGQVDKAVKDMEILIDNRSDVTACQRDFAE